MISSSALLQQPYLASFQQFKKLMILCGQARTVTVNKKAKIPAYILELSFGHHLNEQHFSLHKKNYFKSSAQLCTNHTVIDLQDKLMMCIVNFQRKQIGPIMSDCLVTGAQQELGSAEEKRETTVFLTPLNEVPEGSRVSVTMQENIDCEMTRNLDWQDFLTIDLRIGTIKSYVFRELDGNIKRMSGTVSLNENGEIRTFYGLVAAEFELKNTAVQLLFWANPDPSSEEFKALFSFANNEANENPALLCTVNEGRSAISPAKIVIDGYRIA